MSRSPNTATSTDRRSALLIAAVEEIARAGTRGLRVEEVAKRASVSTALIYHHFGDRSTLLQSALEHIGAQATAYTERGHRSASGRDTLVAVLTDEIQDDHTVRTNSAAWGELRDSAVFDADLRPMLTSMTQRWIDDIADLVRHGHRDGSIDTSVDPAEAGVRLSAAVEGISMRWLTGMLTTDQARGHLASMAKATLGSRPPVDGSPTPTR